MTCSYTAICPERGNRHLDHQLRRQWQHRLPGGDHRHHLRRHDADWRDATLLARAAGSKDPDIREVADDFQQGALQ